MEIKARGKRSLTLIRKKEREKKYVSRPVELILGQLSKLYSLTMRFLFDLVHGDLFRIP